MPVLTPHYAEKKTTEDVSYTASQVIFGPTFVGNYSKKTVTIINTGDNALADCDVYFGPTSSGPWTAADISSTNLATLSSSTDYANSYDVFRCEYADAYLYITALSISSGTDVTVYLDATP